MIEEETIKRIEETLKLTELCQRTTNAPTISPNYFWDMRTLLDLYNKEKEKNKALEIKSNELNGLAEIVQRDYIHKDKIKKIFNKQIKEYEKEKEYRYTGDVNDEIEVLEEMLKDLESEE